MTGERRRTPAFQARDGDAGVCWVPPPPPASPPPSTVGIYHPQAWSPPVRFLPGIRVVWAQVTTRGQAQIKCPEDLKASHLPAQCHARWPCHRPSVAVHSPVQWLPRTLVLKSVACFYSFLVVLIAFHERKWPKPQTWKHCAMFERELPREADRSETNRHGKKLETFCF